MKDKFSDILFEKLVELGLEPETTPERIMAGYWQRSSGTWQWSCRTKDNLEIGSQDTMRECINSKNLTFYKHGLDTIVCAK